MLALLVAIALAGAASGFIVGRQLQPPPSDERVRVSVVALEESTPEPSPTPERTEEPERRTRAGTSGTRSREDPVPEGVSNCPAGCTCEARPPQGVVIVCR